MQETQRISFSSTRFAGWFTLRERRRFSKQWKRNYIVLTKDAFLYFNSPSIGSSSKPRGNLPISGSSAFIYADYYNQRSNLASPNSSSSYSSFNVQQQQQEFIEENSLTKISESKNSSTKISESKNSSTEPERDEDRTMIFITADQRVIEIKFHSHAEARMWIDQILANAMECLIDITPNPEESMYKIVCSSATSSGGQQQQNHQHHHQLVRRRKSAAVDIRFAVTNGDRVWNFSRSYDELLQFHQDIVMNEINKGIVKDRRIKDEDLLPRFSKSKIHSTAGMQEYLSYVQAYFDCISAIPCILRSPKFHVFIGETTI